MNILAFAATSSTKSINNHLVKYAASQLEDAETEILNLKDYELPYFDGVVKATLSVPSFHDNFGIEAGRVNEIK